VFEEDAQEDAGLDLNFNKTRILVKGIAVSVKEWMGDQSQPPQNSIWCDGRFGRTPNPV
jgi:hypothetical protein